MRPAPTKDEDMADDREHRPLNDNVRFGEIATREADVEAPTQEVVRGGGTFESFHHRDYSLFWSGALVSNVGTWMQNYALNIVVYAFRGSQIDLGIVNFAVGIPVLFLAIYAGSLADRVDRKRLIIITQAVLLVQAALLAWLYVSGRLSGNPIVSLAYVVGLSIMAGVMSALAFPSWQSILPDLVPRETLLNAIALNSAQFQSARLIGPLIASALVLAGAGMGEIFYINAASFLFVIGALWAVRPRTYDRGAHAPEESAWHRITAGLRYARENRVVGVIILSTAILTIFAMPYMMLLPAFVDKILGFHAANGLPGADPVVVGYVMAANGFGAVVGALAIASLPRTVSRESLLRFTMLGMALVLLAFAYSRWLPVTLVISALAGAAFITTTSLLNTSVQSTVPNALRGRVMALFVMAFIGIMPLSAAAFGPLGEAIGPNNAIGLGAVILLVWTAVLLLRPRLLGLERKAA